MGNTSSNGDPDHHFAISKLGVHLDVTCSDGEVFLSLNERADGMSSTLQHILSCEQFLAQCFLRLQRPLDSASALKQYFADRGWQTGTTAPGREPAAP